ncbi:MAG: NADH-quinone oxidoreductase subunit NuoE [Lentisphaeria bacterium]|nr:NADH-quinone oxidoreductase subunit NuoE [Lentisphaeria bacterium]
MTVQEIVAKRGNARENLLQILHDLQDSTEGNYLRREDVEVLAREMLLSVSDIVGTATFYTMFSLKPRGRHIIRLCESPPCYIMGEENIREAIREKLGIDFGETTADGLFTLEPSSCLGSCGVAPVMMIDDELYGNLTRDKVGRILDGIAAREPLAAGA